MILLLRTVPICLHTVTYDFQQKLKVLQEKDDQNQTREPKKQQFISESEET